jgi:hypothetical protein
VLYFADVEVISSARAARRLNVGIAKFHRLTEQHQLEPAFKAEGETGAKFWNFGDIERLVALRRQELLDDLNAIDAAARQAS